MQLKTKVIILSALALVFLAVAVRYTFFYAKSCESTECFFENLKTCSRAIYINDQSEATWRYEIVGSSIGTCDVEVTLLQQKTTETDTNSLDGMTMICSLDKGVADYPEKYIEKCHGILKEEIQNMMIKKLHTYLVDNLGEIKTGLGNFSE
jgi:hypothetical protein